MIHLTEYFQGDPFAFTLTLTEVPTIEPTAITAITVGSPVEGSTALPPDGTGGVYPGLSLRNCAEVADTARIYQSAAYTFQAAERGLIDIALDVSCDDVEYPVITVFKEADKACVRSAELYCGSGNGNNPYRLTLEVTADENYLIHLTEYYSGAAYAFTLTLTFHPFMLILTEVPKREPIPFCGGSPVAGNSLAGSFYGSADLGCADVDSDHDRFLSAVYTFQASETGSIEVSLADVGCSEAEYPVITIFTADMSCVGSTYIDCPSDSFSFTGTKDKIYIVHLTEYYYGNPFAFSLSILPEPVPCSTPSTAESTPGSSTSSTWCEKISPLEYSLSGKVKKKAIKDCLMSNFIGDSALPKKIGLLNNDVASSGIVSLAAVVGLMAAVAFTAVAWRRRSERSAWVPVPEVEWGHGRHGSSRLWSLPRFGWMDDVFWYSRSGSVRGMFQFLPAEACCPFLRMI